MNGQELAPVQAPYERRPLGDALDFLRLLWAINHGMATTSRHMKSKFGVTGRQWLIMQVVNEFPGIAASQLARVLHVDRSTLTGALQLMSARGLLLIEDDRHDRRRRRIHLTAKGRQIRHLAVDTMEAAVVRTFSEMSPANLAITRRVLTQLADNLGPVKEAS